MFAAAHLSCAIESLEWITDRRRFAAIGVEWDRVAAGDRAPFLLSACISTWLESFAARRGLRIAALWRDGALAGAMPLLDGWRQWSTPANDHLAFGLLAVDADARTRIVTEVLAASNALVLPALPEDDPAFAELLHAARAASSWTLVQPRDTSLMVDTSGRLEDYRARLSSGVRSEMGRLRRKAGREHQLELAPLASPYDLEPQLDRAFALEASGWKGRNGTAIISTPETEQFYRRLARRFDAAGALRVSELSLDGTLAAMALSFIHRRRVFTLKVAYDEHHRQLAPGLLLLLAMIERCFELGVEAYEFCGPAADYQRRFATYERCHRRMLIYQPGALNAARYSYYRQIRPVLRSAYRASRPVGVPYRGTPSRLRRLVP